MNPVGWTPDQRRRIDELVLATAGLEPEERDEIFAAAETDDESGDLPQILGEVKRRLAEADAAGDDFLQSPLSVFLRTSMDETESADGSGPAPGIFAVLEASERFEVGELLGTGGMAEVYSAFDRRLDREVALKLLGHADTATEQRFLDEARAQARIRHDHVLAIYDVGRLGDRPFLAMERVDGGSLSEVAPTLSLEEKVRLVAQAAEGLHAAHRRGLIHRDVKPSNVLVGHTHSGERRAWVTDFGIAVVSTLVDRESGSMLFGTPHYMAPERIDRGDAAVDRRSDVWSLGATLYQVLAGSPPFDGETPLQVLRAVQTGDPPPLRERAPGLPADLVAVVDQCLRRDPEERYASAKAVAEDLRRFLDGDVVEAHTAGLAYRLTRFAQKHRGSLAVAGVLATGLLMALVVAAVLGLQALRAQRGLEQRQQQAESLVRFMLGDLRERLEPLGRLDLLDAVGEEAMEYFAAVPESELSEDELARRSQALYQIGSVRQLQGDLAGARIAFAESLHLAESLWQRDRADYDRLFGLGQSHFWIGYAHWQAGDRDEAGPHFERYLELSLRLVDLAPRRRDAWMELYYAHSNLGSWKQERGDLAAALTSFEHAHDALTNEIPAAEPASSDWHFELAAAENSLGLVKRQLGRVVEANDHFAEELQIRRRLVLDAPEDRASMEFLATALQYASSFDLAQRNVRRAVARLAEANRLLDALVAHDPENGGWRYKRLWARAQMARAHFAAGDAQAARRLSSEATADAEMLESTDPSQIDWRRSLAVAQIYQGRSTLGGGAFSRRMVETPTTDLERIRRQTTEAVGSLESLLAERPGDRSARRWLGEALLLAADLAELRADASTADAFRRRAREVVEPWAATSSDPEVLEPWIRILYAAGDFAAAARAASTLETLGLPAPQPPSETPPG